MNSELIASRLPRARVVRIDGWGHYVMLDRHSEAGAAIMGFLRAERPEGNQAWREGREVGRQAAAVAASAHRNVLTRPYWPHAVYRRWHLAHT